MLNFVSSLLTKLPSTTSRTVAKVGMRISTHMPEILLGAGTVGAVFSTVLVGRATLHVNDMLDAHKIDIDRINEALEDHEVYEDGTEYSEKDAKHDKTMVYAKTIGMLIKLYGPPVTLMILSLACFFVSHGIMKSRNAALLAAYKIIEGSYMKLKKDVHDKFGIEGDKLIYGFEEEETTETITDPETGKKKKVKSKKINPSYTGSDMYGRWFNQTSPYCTENGLYNEDFLTMSERMFNDELKTKGWVLLNEVYKSLGFPETELGAQVGWIYKGEGDGYIDFGIHDFDATIGEHKSCQAFNDCSGNCKNCPGRYWIYLDFNVDGYILDKIGRANKLNEEYVNAAPLLSPDEFAEETFI